MSAEGYLLRVIYMRYIHRYLHTNSTYKYHIYIIRSRYGIVFAAGRCVALNIFLVNSPVYHTILSSPLASSLPWSRSGKIYYMNFTAVHPNGTMDSELASAIAKLGGDPYAQAPKKTATVSAVARRPTSLQLPTSSVFYAAPSLPDFDGSAYPSHRLVFQPGECTRNDGPGQHPLPAGPPSPPPPAPHQCNIHIHHTQGCYNYSDWHSGTPGPVLPLYDATVSTKLTLEACAAACYKNDPTSLAGVMGGDHCFCGKSADLASPAAKARSIAARAQCETVPCKGLSLSLSLSLSL